MERAVDPICRTPKKVQDVLDVRVIANLVLDRADELAVGVSNMALNKIVYFVHCDHLLETGDPLVTAKIEAWQHGPVFREIYHEFKKWEKGDIKSRAQKIDPFTGEVEVATATFGAGELARIVGMIDRYIHFSAAHLRALSHRDGGPWDRVWDHSGRANPGMRISNELIREFYRPELRQ